jgi:hypothetical protein
LNQQQLKRKEINYLPQARTITKNSVDIPHFLLLFMVLLRKNGSMVIFH